MQLLRQCTTMMKKVECHNFFTIIGQEEPTNGSHLEVVQRSLLHDRRRDLEVKNF